MLEPGNSIEVPFILHAETNGSHDLRLLFVFREVRTKCLDHIFSPDTRLTERHSIILFHKIDSSILCSSVIRYLDLSRAIADF